jgi:hypothetical protein
MKELLHELIGLLDEVYDEAELQLEETGQDVYEEIMRNLEDAVVILRDSIDKLGVLQLNT